MRDSSNQAHAAAYQLNDVSSTHALQRAITRTHAAYIHWRHTTSVFNYTVIDPSALRTVLMGGFRFLSRWRIEAARLQCFFVKEYFPV